MKTLFALSMLFSSLPTAFAGDLVTVQVNGRSYTCSEGGAGGGCSCKLTKDSWGYHVYVIQYNGSDIFTGGAYNNAADAVGACKRKIGELDACK